MACLLGTLAGVYHGKLELCSLDIADIDLAKQLNQIETCLNELFLIDIEQRVELFEKLKSLNR